MPKILFFYSELMPYVDKVINCLEETYNDSITVVSWDKEKLTSYKSKLNPNIVHHNRSIFDVKGLVKIIDSFNPDLIYISGRMDKDYLRSIIRAKKKSNYIVVSGLDSQWNGSIKQWIQIIFNRLLYHKYFDYFFVPGSRQYTFVRLLGYPSHKILLNGYSGDTDLFLKSKRATNDKKVIFIGRLESVKGVDLLLDAWSLIQTNSEKYKEWKLVLIGDGALRKSAEKIVNIVLTGFIEQSEILKLVECDCIFCLPSRYEPWGVVVHEMAAAGLPMILSKHVGAADAFLIDNYNGYILSNLASEELASILEELMLKTRDERILMGDRSRELSRRITPDITAASLRSPLISITKVL